MVKISLEISKVQEVQGGFRGDPTVGSPQVRTSQKLETLDNKRKTLHSLKLKRIEFMVQSFFLSISVVLSTLTFLI